MARIDREGTARLIVAETDEELALMAHGRLQGGLVTLLEGFYAVQGNALLLPLNATTAAAQRVCRAFERAALAHREAERRRSEFRLLKS